MMSTVIRRGDEISNMNEGGFEIVTGYNGSVIYTDHYEIDDDGSSTKTDERMFTLEEIGHLLKEVDRRNHNVVYEEVEEQATYWLETEYNFGDFREKKWALHKKICFDDKWETEEDEVVLWGLWSDFERENTDESWKKLDAYIENKLGFLPEYEIN